MPIPKVLNNPFETSLPEIAKIAAREFQEFIIEKSPEWDYNFDNRPGKMFGVLVIQNKDLTYQFLGAVSGQLSNSQPYEYFVPPIFDESTDDYFFNKGMASLTAFGHEINRLTDSNEIAELKQQRKDKSIRLQEYLFENTHFNNRLGESKNVLEIFDHSSHGKPPSAAGECAAPKLLQYAYSNQLKPIAVAEFWWGNSGKNKSKTHQDFYPACKLKCRPILEFMLNDSQLWKKRH